MSSGGASRNHGGWPDHPNRGERTEKMKQLVCGILALAMLCVLGLTGCAEDASANDTVTVGNLTPMSGHFFSDLWGNNTSDMDVRGMVFGYGTVAWTVNGNVEVDRTAVEQVDVKDDAEGNRTYTFAMRHNLAYNDGTPITAKDYVFNVLLRSSPVIAELGGQPATMAHLVGYEGYLRGEPFAGVRLLGAHEFSLTISADSLPYFYELQMVNVEPTPVSVIAPGCDVRDEGAGAHILDGEAAFDEAMLQKTIMDPDTGYLSQPRLTSGAYQLTSFDRQANEARFQMNPHYLGNYEGKKPSIPNVVFRAVDADTMFEELQSGKVDILNKISSGDSIEAGRALVAEEKMGCSSYLRAGLNLLNFACEQGPTQSPFVRKAVAMCIDETALCNQYLKGYGVPVFGYYGLGQWMAQDGEQLLQLALYTFNANGAVGMLNTDGWLLNERGEPFVPGEDKLRHKKEEDGTLTPLQLRCALAKGSGLTPFLKAELTENLDAIGVGLTIDELPFPELLRQFYRQDERRYDIIQMATNFYHVYDPYYQFQISDEVQGLFNTTGIRDEQLMLLAGEMRGVEPGDREGYQEKWMAFQQRFVDVLPMVPLYSNIYFDFYSNRIEGYAVNAHWGWGDTMCYVSFATPENA